MTISRLYRSKIITFTIAVGCYVVTPYTYSDITPNKEYEVLYFDGSILRIRCDDGRVKEFKHGVFFNATVFHFLKLHKIISRLIYGSEKIFS